MKRKPIEPGTRFSHLVVIGEGEPKKTRNRPSTSVVRCDCGKVITVENSELKLGRKKSCGCRHDESYRIHDGCGTRLYITWKNMKSRASGKSTNPRNRTYVERGISVCEDWRDFVKFREWAISNGYSDDLTIDRIDPMGNYCPENCRFVPMSEQSKNRIHKGKVK